MTSFTVLFVVFRFEKGRIYTFIGEVVVSVNPYKQMDIYGKEVIEDYRGRELYENPPHLYAVADAAYKAMKRRAKDTCIVISGTAATKHTVTAEKNNNNCTMINNTIIRFNHQNENAQMHNENMEYLTLTYQTMVRKTY